MGWFDSPAADPVECPRGWGPVTFVRNIVLIPPIFVVDRRCPVGGVNDCTKCRYQVNPAAIPLLTQQLEELEALRGGMLSDAEYRVRRRLIVQARAPGHEDPGEGAAKGAAITGPLGGVVLAGGVFLSFVVHPGFLSVAAAGLVLSAVAVGLSGLSRIKRRALEGPSDPHSEDLPEDRHLLEARLQQAQEELGFFRELHKLDSVGPPPVSKTDDS